MLLPLFYFLSLISAYYKDMITIFLVFQQVIAEQKLLHCLLQP